MIRDTSRLRMKKRRLEDFLDRVIGKFGEEKDQATRRHYLNLYHDYQVKYRLLTGDFYRPKDFKRRRI